jgi:hypothetical protein
METTDQSRLVASSSDSDFTLTIDDALALYAAAGSWTTSNYLAQN